jgi:hypothetical protein
VPAAQIFLERVLENESMMMQPYIESVETEGEISVIAFDEEVSHVVRKVPVAGDYRVQDDFGATDFPIEAPDGLIAQAQGALETARRILGLPGPFLYGRADYLRTESHGYVLNELELVEPSLFFRHADGAAPRLAECLLARLKA